MPVGDSYLYSGEGYLAVGRESTFGTYTTCTAGMEFLSNTLKVMKDSKILQQVERKRTMTKSFSLGKTVEGDLEYHFYPTEDSGGYILQNAFGGTVTSATATGETAGGLGFTHTFNMGSMNQAYPSLCLNQRKGPSSGGKVFEYSGVRVNQLSIVAEIDEPLKFTASLICKDATQSSNDVETALTTTAIEPLSFSRGRLSIETSFASLTSTSFWHVQSINYSLNNNLKNDATSRRIGSDTIDVLPIGIQSYELSCQMRYNTTTAYAAMLAATELAGEFEFTGSTMTGSSIRSGLKLRFQKLTVKDAGDPEVSGPDGTLVSNVTFNVLRDESAAGYAVIAELTNLKSSYA